MKTWPHRKFHAATLSHILLGNKRGPNSLNSIQLRFACDCTAIYFDNINLRHSRKNIVLRILVQADPRTGCLSLFQILLMRELYLRLLRRSSFTFHVTVTQVYGNSSSGKFSIWAAEHLLYIVGLPQRF